ncbi:MAG: hypothetical protein HRU23_15980 [Gammaproteobacteria bacterium]|nr:hypothetical protein [Gammaproteobacteria bacterium]
MTHTNQLQTFKIICPHCGDKQLRTTQWLLAQQHIKCSCGQETLSTELITEAVNDLK